MPTDNRIGPNFGKPLDAKVTHQATNPMFRINEDMFSANDRHLIEILKFREVLVLVKPCKHSKIDGHFTEYDPWKDRALDGHWCPGALGEKP